MERNRDESVDNLVVWSEGRGGRRGCVDGRARLSGLCGRACLLVVRVCVERWVGLMGWRTGGLVVAWWGCGGNGSRGVALNAIRESME